MFSRRGNKETISSTNRGQQSLDLALLTLQRLKQIKPTTTYLSKQDLATLRVKCTELDLGTGRPRDGGDQFLELLPLQKMNTIAKQCGLDKYEGLTVPEHPGETNWHSANFLSIFFHRHLTLYDEAIRMEEQGKECTTPDLLARTGWSERE